MSRIVLLEAEVSLYSNNETCSYGMDRNEESQEMHAGVPVANLCRLVFTRVCDDMTLTSSVEKPEQDAQTRLCSWVVSTCDYKVGVGFLSTRGRIVLRGELQRVVSVWGEQEDGGVRLSGESHHGGLFFGGMYQEYPSPLLPGLRFMSNQFRPFQWWVPPPPPCEQVRNIS